MGKLGWGVEGLSIILATISHFLGLRLSTCIYCITQTLCTGETLSDATTLRELGSDNTVSLLLHHNPSPSNHTQPTGEDSSSPTHSTQQDDMPQTQEGDDMPPTQEGEEDTPPTQEGEEDTPPTQERETTPPAQEGEEDTPPTQGDEDMTPTQEGETAPQREEDTQEEEEDTPPAQEQEDTCPTQEGETASPTQGEEDTPPTQGGENAPTQEEGLSSSTISPTHPASGKDLLITTVPDGRDTKEVMVKIERSTFKKPFLGGYRHRVSEMEYHHAAVQTLPRPRPRKDVRFNMHVTMCMLCVCYMHVACMLCACCMHATCMLHVLRVTFTCCR